MHRKSVEIKRIKKLLGSSGTGLNITSIAGELQLDRNLVSKCLDVMLAAGEIELRSFGRSKIYRIHGNMQKAKMLSLSSDLALCVDESFTITDANDQFLDYTGLSRVDTVGRPMDEVGVDILMHKDILLNLKDALRGTEYAREISVQRGNGRHFFKAKLIPIGSGDLQRHVAIVLENITQKKKAELDLKSSEARYKAVVEDQTELICRMLSDTTILFINEAWCKFFNRPKDDYLGSRLAGLLSREDREKLAVDIKTAQQKKKVLTYSNRLVFPAYGERWLDWTLRGIPDEYGRITEFQLVAHDITELRKAESALRASEENFRTIFDQSPIGVALVARDFSFLRVNPELCRIMGYSKNELQSIKSLQVTHPDFRDATIRQVEKILKGSKDHFRQDRRYIRKDGCSIWLRVTVRVITDESKVFSHFLAMYEDVTEQKRLEESLHMAMFCMDKAVHPITWIDTEGRIIYVNDAFCGRIGYRREELLNMAVWDIDPLISREKWAQHWQDVREKKHIKIESAHLTRDGTRMPVEITISHLQYGDIEYHCSYTTDIPERQHHKPSTSPGTSCF